MTDDLETTAWDIEAAELPDHWSLDIQQRRDYVIERWLIVGGDTRPFLDWVLRCGHDPSRRVIEIVAQMMGKSAGAKLDDQMVPPFGLIVDRSGHAHAPKDMEAEVERYCVAAISDNKIDAGTPPGLADREAWQFARSTGYDIGLSTVEATRKAFRKSQGKYLRPPKGK